MKVFEIPHVDNFGSMAIEERITALIPVAEWQAHRMAAKGRGYSYRSVHVDDYKSAGSVGLLAFCGDFHRSAYDDNGHFRSVVMRVARNAIVDEHRRLVGRMSRGKWRGLNMVDLGVPSYAGLPLPEENMQDESESPREALERSEMPDRAEALLSLLDARSEKVVRLIYYEGRTQVEVGQILGVTNSRISQILQAALKKLASQ